MLTAILVLKGNRNRFDKLPFEKLHHPFSLSRTLLIKDLYKKYTENSSGPQTEKADSLKKKKQPTAAAFNARKKEKQRSTLFPKF